MAKSFVFWSYRHEPMVLAGKTLRGHYWLELTEAEAASLTPEERRAVALAKARRELTVHPMVDGRPLDFYVDGSTVVGRSATTESADGGNDTVKGNEDGEG